MLSITSSAQLADNFEVTDINGQTHTLYQDYLNQGEAMVLGFFYVGAPMVNDLYPELQYLLNTTWDSLPANAILMSEADNTEALQSFAQELQLNIPIVANEGGAGSAMAPYVGGEFGTFYGYPMFVVIGPDGTVIFDPWGEDSNDVLASIQDALFQVLNITSVESQQTADITVYGTSGRLQVQDIPTGGARLEVFGLSGRGICSQVLSCGSNAVDLPFEGMVFYRLSTPGWVQTGKAWVGR